MASVEPGSTIISGLYLIPTRRKCGVIAEVILSRGAPNPGAVQMPTDPIGTTNIAIVRNGVLRFIKQIVCRLIDVYCGVTWIAHGQVFAAALATAATCRRNCNVVDIYPISSAGGLADRKSDCSRHVDGKGRGRQRGR